MLSKLSDAEMLWQWGLGYYLGHSNVGNSCSLEATKYERKKLKSDCSAKDISLSLMFLIRLSNFTHLLWAGVLKCGIVLPFAVCHPVKGTARLDLWHFSSKVTKEKSFSLLESFLLLL